MTPKIETVTILMKKHGKKGIMGKILITLACFAKTDKAPLILLKEKGFECIQNHDEQPYTKSKMIELVKDIDGIILGTDPCDRDVIAAGPKLKVISRFGVGYDNVDTEYCAGKGIAFYRTVGVNADAVADSAFAMILAVSKRVVPVNNMMKSGKWFEAESFEINHKTLGLIGFGNVGAKVAKRAVGFDMKIIAYDPFRNQELAKSVNTTYVDTIEQVLRESDVVSLHLPRSAETYHIIGAEQIAMMKSGAILINTARGGIVDENALADALEQNKILGAGLDVFENEPLPEDSRLFKLDNTVLSPHGAGDTVETLSKVSLAAAQNLLKGFGIN